MNLLPSRAKRSEIIRNLQVVLNLMGVTEQINELSKIDFESDARSLNECEK